jgi:hypothetical protein
MRTYPRRFPFPPLPFPFFFPLQPGFPFLRFDLVAAGVLAFHLDQEDLELRDRGVGDVREGRACQGNG